MYKFFLKKKKTVSEQNPDLLVSVDSNFPIVEALEVLLYLKNPIHQYMKVLEMLFLFSKSVPMCRSMWRRALPVWAKNRVK